MLLCRDKAKRAGSPSRPEVEGATARALWATWSRRIRCDVALRDGDAGATSGLGVVVVVEAEGVRTGDGHAEPDDRTHDEHRGHLVQQGMLGQRQADPRDR